MLCHGTVCVVGKIRDLILQLSKSSIYSTKPYGVKVNKSQSLLQAAVTAGTGADVSSLHELNDAIRAGCRGNDLCATGPAKTIRFLQELILQGARIVVDSVEEMDDLMEVAKRWKSPTGRISILLRLRPAFSHTSRFGMSSREVSAVLQKLETCNPLKIDGFHFHLSGYSPVSRVNAFFDTLPLIACARSLGHSPCIIDIGGGLPVQYVEGNCYKAWLSSQTQENYRTRRVPDAFYPYGGDINAEHWLTQFLGGADPAGKRVCDALIDEGLTLCVEPGRSLANQSAISVFRVCRVRPHGDSGYVIFVEGSSFSACETWFNSEFLSDPLHIRQNSHEPPPAAKAWIAGHSCLDEDVITNRLITFKHLPEPGDLLIFANTAGYQMDLLENQFHRHPLPTRLTAVMSSRQNLIFTVDN
ncbi:Y4yA family PLP-dependent enzyme [Serratia marcescens]|uniref:Y4yA family PLP-dependent enzyme n=1 Tax=Serratia marcescens TaxID=615 RepID=UPI001CEF5FE9|nr:Y4yA family PLP-dependent enzyme [Serratia marcescens]